MNLAPVFAANGMAGTLGLVLYMGVIIGIFYFLLIRPQKKQQKAHEALLMTIAAGDSVLTSSGFYGVSIDVMEEVVIVEFVNNKNCRIPMKKDAIVEVEKAGGATTEE
ncbi:MAG: preprotein translocase subunit YajC [Acetivibrio ethanolgignens]